MFHLIFLMKTIFLVLKLKHIFSWFSCSYISVAIDFLWGTDLHLVARKSSVKPMLQKIISLDFFMFLLYFQYAEYNGSIAFIIASIFCQLYQESLSVMCNFIHIIWFNFVTAFYHKGRDYVGIQAMFPKLLDAKVSAGVFAEPQVKYMFACEAMEMKMT